MKINQQQGSIICSWCTPLQIYKMPSLRQLHYLIESRTAPPLLPFPPIIKALENQAPKQFHFSQLYKFWYNSLYILGYKHSSRDIFCQSISPHHASSISIPQLVPLHGYEAVEIMGLKQGRRKRKIELCKIGQFIDMM